MSSHLKKDDQDQGGEMTEAHRNRRKTDLQLIEVKDELMKNMNQIKYEFTVIQHQMLTDRENNTKFLQRLEAFIFGNGKPGAEVRLDRLEKSYQLMDEIENFCFGDEKSKTDGARADIINLKNRANIHRTVGMYGLGTVITLFCTWVWGQLTGNK